MSVLWRAVKVPQLNRNIRVTHSGALVEPIKTGLPKSVESICPDCLEVIPAVQYEEDNKVLMEKHCPKHGCFRDVVFSDVDIYSKAEEWLFDEGKGVENVKVENGFQCPDHCGICDRHTSHTAVGNIDLTNRCDLSCATCFASTNTAGDRYEPSYEQIVEMLSSFRNERPVPTNVIQFSGGEPTLHPRFLEILRAARALGFDHIQVASNGLKLSDFEFAERCRESGLHTVYLQFDGVSDDVNETMRGKALLDKKLRVVENARRLDMRIILVPTVVKGVNDNQIGDIVDFALENVDIVQGVSFQPVAFTGRIPNDDIVKRRVTLSDLAIWLEEQTGYAKAKDDWFPLSALSPLSHYAANITGREATTVTCHPHCALCTFLFVDTDTNTPIPLMRFVDWKDMLVEVQKLSESTNLSRLRVLSKITLFNKLRKYYHAKRAPTGLTFAKFLAALNNYTNKDVSRGPGFRTRVYPKLFVAGMHFMDAFNYDLERIRRCVIHYGAPNGRIYPFCSYNSGRTYRKMIEKLYSVSAYESPVQINSP
jgi:uncharacterized radical SAM superfamily Fe-S cluster-containing enzyme